MPLFGKRTSPAPVATAGSPPPNSTARHSTATHGSTQTRSRSMFARRRSSSSSASSIHSDTHNGSRPRRKGLFGMGGQRKSDPVLDRDPQVLAAREGLASAERAEQEADRALELARRAVLEAREHCRLLETQAAEEARLAKAKRTEARGLGKQAKGLGRHN
ncbi:unnamed protein product [Rhizoctonia solani]|uniref:Uncharacterized protein n=2 Tax=Rhizoctonia solani AG-3 TaxID=1086053 RepID=A0A074RVP8_9AGAM|nr:hypothetical protein RSOL_415870 [Rhizoctonia solani AG-3 Rhs1AP]KEP49375.1 hypothetical protein V565_101750 [Rhizoctonia solani 123E]CAE6409281.1 unnamed protein product [Rhizoctonia solani]